MSARHPVECSSSGDEFELPLAEPKTHGGLSRNPARMPCAKATAVHLANNQSSPACRQMLTTRSGSDYDTSDGYMMNESTTVLGSTLTPMSLSEASIGYSSPVDTIATVRAVPQSQNNTTAFTESAPAMITTTPSSAASFPVTTTSAPCLSPPNRRRTDNQTCPGAPRKRPRKRSHFALFEEGRPSCVRRLRFDEDESQQQQAQQQQPQVQLGTAWRQRHEELLANVAAMRGVRAPPPSPER